MGLYTSYKYSVLLLRYTPIHTICLCTTRTLNSLAVQDHLRVPKISTVPTQMEAQVTKVRQTENLCHYETAIVFRRFPSLVQGLRFHNHWDN